MGIHTHIYTYEHITTNENMLSTLRIFEEPKGEGKTEPWGGFTLSEISHVAADSRLINDDAACFC